MAWGKISYLPPAFNAKMARNLFVSAVQHLDPEEEELLACQEDMDTGIVMEDTGKIPKNQDAYEVVGKALNPSDMCNHTESYDEDWDWYSIGATVNKSTSLIHFFCINIHDLFKGFDILPPFTINHPALNLKSLHQHHHTCIHSLFMQ